MAPASAEPSMSATIANNDEIDLKNVAKALLRRWQWIASCGAFGIVLSTYNMLTTKPIYQGEFQIVLDQSRNLSGAAGLLSDSPALAAITGMGSGSSDSIATEMQILNSPSVLRPIFDAVKDNKPEEVAKGMRFHNWAKTAITVEKRKSTSVLNIEFRDNDKDLVLPITRMISEAYQSYSNRGRTREINNVISYLKEQIKTIKPQADSSSRAALDYGYKNGLGLLDGLPVAGNVTGASGAERRGATVGGSGGSLEVARSVAQQKVRALQVQIQEATKAGTGSIYFASQLASLTDKSSTFDQLTSVEAKLAELRSRFKDNDPLVQKLERERNILVRYINLQTIALLKGELDLAQANLKALNRPVEVVAQHRELTQRALRDEATLVTLRNQLKQFELERARSTEPWELISTPTLLESPVAPRKTRGVALGLLAGVLIGSAAAILVDRRTGLVFTNEELQDLLPFPLLRHLPALTPTAWSDAADLLASGPLATTSSRGQIALIPIGDVPTDQLQNFCTEMRRALGNRELLVSTDLRETSKSETQLLITAPGVATRTQLSQLCQKMALQKAPVAGWVLLDPELNLE